MGTGYTRNDADNNIADGNVINAADFDGEFDAIVTAFSTSGHSHDGTSAEGGPVTVLGPAQDFVVSATTVTPKSNNTLDLGTSSLTFKDMFIRTIKITVDADADDLTGDSAVGRITLGASEDLNLYHGGTNSYIVNDTGDLILDTADDIVLDAAGGDVFFKANAAQYAALTNTSGNLIIKSGTTTALTFSGANVTAAGILKTDDATDATSTTDGSLQTDGGLSVAKDAVFGNDVKLLSDASVLSFGTNSDVTLTHVHDTALKINDAIALQFRDSALAINSSADGQLDIIADGSVEITTPILNFDTDAQVINFGAGDDVKITHVHDVGLTITNTNTGDNTPIVLQLKSEEDELTTNEVIASLEFAAGDSSTGDAEVVAAGIHAIAEGAFESNANPTKLVFTTGVTETAAASAAASNAKMTLSSAGLLTIADDLVIKDGGTIGVSTTNDAITISSAGIVTFKDDIIIKNGGTIGSVSDTDAITIATNGQVTLTQTLNGTGATLTNGALLVQGDAGVSGVGINALQANNTGSHVSARYDVNSRKIGFNINNSGGQGFLAFNSNSVSGSGNQTYDVNGVAAKIDYTGDMTFDIAASGTAGNTISYSQAMTIKSDSNVGIGATSPSNRLHILLDSSTTDDTVDVMRVEATSSGTPAVGFGPTIRFQGERAGAASDMMGRIGFIADNMTSSRIDGAFVVEAGIDGTPTERFRITSDGDTGIGTGGDFTYTDITGSGAGLVIGSSSVSSAGIAIRTSTSGTSRIYFADNSGSADARKAGSIEFDHSTDDMTIQAEDDLRLYAKEDVVMRGGTYTFDNADGSSEYARIDSSGQVGIGRSPSSVLLDIEGSTSDTFSALRLRNSGQVAGSAVKAIWSLNRDGSNIDFEGGVITVGKEQNWTTSASTVDSFMAFNTSLNESSSERMRLDSNGKLLIGDVSSHTDDLLQIETPASGGGQGIQIRRNDSNSSQQVGTISFGNNSDADLVQLVTNTDGAVNSGKLAVRIANAGTSNKVLEVTKEKNLLIEDGDLIIGTSGHGIDFSSTSDSSVGSSVSELLDDYEEGFFDMSVHCTTSGSITLSSGGNRCVYTKIGRQVFVGARLDVDSVSSPQGQLVLHGLPFATVTGVELSHQMSGSVIVYNPASDTTQLAHEMSIQTISGSDVTALLIRDGNGLAAGVSALADHIDADSLIAFSMTYFAAS